MWIEIYCKERTRKTLLNTDNVSEIHLRDEIGNVLISIIGEEDFLILGGAHWYTALVMALQGIPTDLGELGHVKPLGNNQREEIAKRLNYMDAVSGGHE